MITPKFFIEDLKCHNIDFFAGVPDSLLKNICAYITDNSLPANNIIAANEGAAVGLASGYHLATGKVPVVYMQNSGEGNAINPLMSLTDKDVYNIPVIILIGWRGEPGIKDEPQHIKQGKVTVPLLEAMGIKYIILSKEEAVAKNQIIEAVEYIKETNEAFTFLIQKDTFDAYKLQNIEDNNLTLSRENAIKVVASSIEKDAVVISTTGMISRELFEHRECIGDSHEKDFLTVGSMGHASQIALGIALHKPYKKVYCFDGDGASIMHLGSLAIIASKSPKNYYHIIFNNGAHDSVGGQPTVGFKVNIKQIALNCGYRDAFSVDNQDELISTLKKIEGQEGPILLEIKVKKGNRKDLGRPTTTPIQNKNNFMNFLKDK